MQKVAFRLFVPTTMSLVDYEDALAVDWRTPHPWVSNPRPIAPGPKVVAWIMSPPGPNRGGHQNIFRFIRFMEDAGHEVRISLYSAIPPDSPAEVAERVSPSTSYTKLAASIENFPADGIPSD